VLDARQFNDIHVILPDLKNSSTVYRAFYIVNGVRPDISSDPDYVPPGLAVVTSRAIFLWCAKMEQILFRHRPRVRFGFSRGAD
jgi:hypothetical protein